MVGVKAGTEFFATWVLDAARVPFNASPFGTTLRVRGRMQWPVFEQSFGEGANPGVVSE
jgi:hypothetical protein